MNRPTLNHTTAFLGNDPAVHWGITDRPNGRITSLACDPNPSDTLFATAWGHTGGHRVNCPKCLAAVARI